MSTCLPSHLSDQALERDLSSVVTQERGATAKVLAYIAEFDARKLYLPAVHPSMYSYCIHVLRLSEDAACRRTCAARAAREFPAIFAAVEEGRLHLSAVVMLAPHLTPENANELLAAAGCKTRSEIAQLLAHRFPRPELPARIHPMPMTPALSSEQLVPPVESSAPARIEAAARSRVEPLAPQKYGLQLTMDQDTHDLLEYARSLLSHQIPSRDIAQVFRRTLAAAIPQLEKLRFAATARPRPGQRRSTTNPRCVPALVKCTVWKRDGGQCTFVSKAGKRCPARTMLELDHIDEVARGGQATVENMRLRCRAHNQYTAECTFGREFMNHKRQEAQQAAVARAMATAARQPEDSDVIRCLRTLGCRADEARRAAESCETIPDASLEERVRAALSFLVPHHLRPTKLGPRVMG